MSSNSETKLNNLKSRLRELAWDGRFAIAFSGGLDSRFLAHVAMLADLHPLLLHAKGPHMAESESTYARQWATANGFNLRLVDVDPLAVPEVAANDRMRCYHCKHTLFSLLLREATGLALCDGTQASDSGAYRPGKIALKELRIISPLAQAGLTKSEIRLLARQTGMEQPDQRARPCLLTRFAYLCSPDRTALSSLEKAEEAVEELLRGYTPTGDAAEVPDFRIRYLNAEVIELHLTPFIGTGDTLPEGASSALEQAIFQTTGKRPAAIRVMPKLSGFFDRE